MIEVITVALLVALNTICALLVGIVLGRSKAAYEAGQRAGYRGRFPSLGEEEAHTDWAKFAREQVAEAEARGWRKDAKLGWVRDVPKPEKEVEK